MEVYRAKDLNFTYAGCEKTALQHIDFSVNEGDFVLLFGASGSGKTTLLPSVTYKTCCASFPARAERVAW